MKQLKMEFEVNKKPEVPGMRLLTKALLKQIPPLYAQEKLGDDAIVHTKFFTPDSNWTWYVTEIDPATGECFGLVDGFEKEFGYFMLEELAEATGPLGLPIERDLYWHPTTIGEVKRF